MYEAKLDFSEEENAMNWFYNLKISTKILSGFILVALIAAIVGAVGYSGMQNLKTAQDTGATIYLPSVESILIMSEAQTTVDSAENALLNEELTGKDRQDQYVRITEALARADEARAIYEPLPQTPNEKAAWDKFVPAWSGWVADDAKFIALSKQFDAGRSAEIHDAMVKQALTVNAASFTSAGDLLKQITDINVANSTSADKTSDAATKAATILLLITIAAAFLISIILGTFISRIISKPLRFLALTADKLASGEADVEVRAKSKDEIGQLMGSFVKMVENIQNQAAAGMLIASGDLTVEVVPKSDKDLLAVAMKTVIEALRELVAEAGMLTKAAVEGRLDTRGNEAKFSGGFKEIVNGVNQTLDAVIGPLNVAGEYIDRISKGDIPAKITDNYNGDFNEIKNNLNTCIDAVNALVEDALMLAAAGVEGRLDTRADASKHGGDFAKIVNGVNQTLDAVIGPLNVAAEYVERISKGDIPSKITDSYNGDFNEIKNNLNICIDAINDLVLDADILVTAAVEGRLETRADASKHGGDFARIVNGVNQTLDAIVDPLNIALAYIEKAANGEELEDLENNFKGQYGILIGNLQMVKTSLYTLLEESAKLNEASKEGNLSYRADVSKLKGGYAQIIDGVNATLDAVIEPIRDVTEVMNQISNGNLQVSIKGSYKGDLAVLAKSVDTTATRLNAVVGEISNTISEIADGNLALDHLREFIGDFKTISDSLNTIIDSLNEVLGDINEASEQVAAGSRQVSEGSQALSQGATEQASSIEELTASIAEIAAQTRQNAGNANQANDLATAAKENAAKGNSHMKEMLGSMTDISDSSVNISKIIKVIDDIAFQTNILALNAAVEAARAGQHGKGFAVVAEEVRNLAARSANAAKETTDLIEGSLDKVQTGTKIATSTAQALDEIVGGIDKVANLVGNIAVASNEQASGIAQINMGIEQVSQVVQNNSATAEESAAASEELTSQAELLKQQVSRFQLARDGNQHSAGGRKLLGGSGPKAQTSSAAVRKPNIILEAAGFDKY